MHAPVAPAGNPSSGQFHPATFDGQLLGTVFRLLVFGDPAVSGVGFPGRIKPQLAARDAMAGQGFYLFPIDLCVHDIFWPRIFHDEEKSWGPLPDATEAALLHIRTSSRALLGLLRSKRIIVRDLNNAELHATLWQRDGLALDLKKSDLYEAAPKPWLQDNPDNKLLFRGLWLSVPASADGGKSVNDAPTANPSLPKQKAKRSNPAPDQGSRGGPKPKYDGERLKADAVAHMKANGPFPCRDNLVDWCLEHGRIKLRAGKKPPKNKQGKPSEEPDLKTVKALINKHQIDLIKGLIAKR